MNNQRAFLRTLAEGDKLLAKNPLLRPIAARDLLLPPMFTEKFRMDCSGGVDGDAVGSGRLMAGC